MTEVISIKNLEHSYKKGVPVLRGVDLQIAPGEKYVAMGSSFAAGPGMAGEDIAFRCVNVTNLSAAHSSLRWKGRC